MVHERKHVTLVFPSLAYFTYHKQLQKLKIKTNYVSNQVDQLIQLKVLKKKKEIDIGSK